MRHIFQYEWKKLMAEQLIWILMAIVTVLVFAALINGHAWLHFQEKQLNRIQQDYSRQADSVQQAIPIYEQQHTVIGIDALHNPSIFYGSFKTIATKPVKSMAIYNTGQSDIYPYYTISTALDKRKLIQEEEIQNPIHLMIGKLDLAFVIIYLMPLLVIALSFDLYSSEEESKTLILVKAQEISITRYVFYKMLFRFLLLTTLLVTLVVTATVWLEPEMFLKDELVDALKYVALSIAYLLFWFSLCFFVNAWKKSSVANGVILLSCWVLLLLLLPFVVSFIASETYSIPSRELQSVQKRDVQKALDREDLMQKMIQEHPGFDRFQYDTTVQLIFEASHGYVKLAAYQQELDRRTYPYEKKILDQLYKQEKFCQHFRFLSPAISLNLGMGRLAANSTFHYVDYLESRDKYHQTWRDFLIPKIFKKEVISEQEMEQLPRFHWKDQHAYTVLDTGLDILIMLLFTAFFWVMAFRKY